MNKKIYLLPLLLLALIFVSCEETKEAGKYDNWKARGEMFIDSIAAEAAAQTEQTPIAERIYSVLDQVNRNYIYYKKNIDYPPTSNVSPLYTDSVVTNYRMSYFNGDIVQQTFTGKDPDGFSKPVGFTVDKVISGWTWLLQQMKVGERWTLYIPWKSGYGSATGPSGDLQPYSTLVYDVQLVEIVSQ